MKGEKLLNRDRFKWAAQTDPKNEMPYAFSPDVRRGLAKEFLDRGKRKEAPGRLHMTAYGQSCLSFAESTMRLLSEQNAKLFAAAIPRGVGRPPAGHNPEHPRKDLVFLFERYSYFLEEENETGLIVMDQVERGNDRRFGQRIADYFAKTEAGRRRAERVVPVPMFVTQDISYALQAADVCLYAINWGFRLPSRGMNAESRGEIAASFGWRLGELQWRGRVVREGGEFDTYGIVYVADPFTFRRRDTP